MRWTKKTKTIPELGETRLKKKFLFFPKTLNGETRWGEIATILEKYIEILVPEHPMVGGSYPTHIWKEVKFKN